VAVCVLLVGACVPDLGNGSDTSRGPSLPRDTGPSAADVDAGSTAAQDCEDPRIGPLGGRALEIVRSVGGASQSSSSSASAIPSVEQFDPSGSIVLSLGAPTDVPAATCVRRIVLAATSDPGLRSLAGARAVIEGVPLVIAPELEHDVHHDVHDVAIGIRSRQRAIVRRLAALGVKEVAVYGTTPAWIAGDDLQVIELAVDGSDVLGLALSMASDPDAVDASVDRGGPPVLVLVREDDVAAQVEVVARAAEGFVPVVVPRSEARAAGLLDEVDALGPGATVSWAATSPQQAREFAALIEGTVDGSRGDRWSIPDRPGGEPELWLGDVRDPAAALAAAVAASARRASFVAVDGADLRLGVERTQRMRAAHARPDATVEVVLVGAVEEHTGWQLDTVLTGTASPGGGFLPLEDRRIVALYGSPGAPSLGLLGEQDDAATIARAIEVASRYADAADGRTAVPGLDMIATVASSAAEPTGDYSRRVPISRLRPLVDLAREAGVVVFLDLQPGRTSFVTQAQEYEELLLEPHVHLALDPEWRIGPRERHLVRIGSVDAVEVQEVADWLAALVRRERLPQKVLMLHQFTVGMLPDRDTIVVPEELVGVVHIDGQGPLPLKDRTYAVLTEGAERPWAWGWKNFTRIDVPVATPEQSIDRVPVPVVITYQ